MKLGPQHTEVGKKETETQKNQISSIHMGWTQHWERDSPLECIYEQMLLKISMAGYMEKSL